MEDKRKQPLLEHSDDEDEFLPNLSMPKLSFPRLSTLSLFSSFVADEADIAPIDTFTDFVSTFREESSKLWFLAGPAIFTSLCQYSLGAFTQTFAGHVSTLELTAFSIENSVIACLSLDIMDGKRGGNAVRAGRGRRRAGHARNLFAEIVDHPPRNRFTLDVSLHFCVVVSASDRTNGEHITSSREDRDLDNSSAVRLRLEFSTVKFLQAQSKIMAMAWISGAAFVINHLRIRHRRRGGERSTRIDGMDKSAMVIKGEEEELEVAEPKKVEDGGAREVECGEAEGEDGEEVDDWESFS
ncbi:hypothetical protein ACS0TY_032050 [Phlomoides rotata]